MGGEKRCSWQTIKAPDVRPLRDAVGKIAHTLQRANAFNTLCADAVVAGEPVTIIANDPYRPTRTGDVLQAIPRAMGRGASRPEFRLLFATGTHRVAEDERAAFERSILAGTSLPITEVRWHDADDAAQLSDVCGVSMHRWAATGRFLMPIGSVAPHYFAGVTGPHKTVTIGIMARRDIERNHAHAIHPAADLMRLHGNPVFQETAGLTGRLAAAGKHICAVAQVVAPGGLVYVAVGDPVESVHLALPSAARTHVAHVDRPADLVHLRVAPPLNRNLYQADKALKNNHRLVRDGGGIVLEADCNEGIGPDWFLESLRAAPDYAGARRRVEREGYRLGDHKVIKLRHLTDPQQRGVRVALVARGMAPACATAAGMTPFTAVDEARGWLIDAIDGAIECGYTVEDAGTRCVRFGRL